jgi:cytochrome oxidase Cu insertion factor (SCO1/SenC/PrrC family)
MKNILSASPRNPLSSKSKLLTAFVLGFSIVAWVAVAAQSPATQRQMAEATQQKKSLTKSAKAYACPMHPEVKSTKHGKCPKCGMALRLMSPEANLDSGAVDVSAASAAAKTSAGSENGSGADRKMNIPDVEILDQDGRALHFYTDLIKGKTVAINFIFTNCTTICPPLAATFARVQKEMGDKVGRDVHFISISVDPLTDTPERLKAWGAKFHAGSGWTFVTGDKEEINKLLAALGASVSRREDHSPTVIVGNDLKGVWTRTYGLARTSQMVGLILNVMEGKTETAVTEEAGKP